jgi:hypothetical protein
MLEPAFLPGTFLAFSALLLFDPFINRYNSLKSWLAFTAS